MEALREAIIDLLCEDMSMIGEPTNQTEAVIKAFNDAALAEQKRGVSLPLIDASEYGA